MKKEVFRIINENPKYLGYSIEEIEATPNYPLLVDNLRKRLHQWNGKIIILDAVRANYLIDYDGTIITTDSSESYLRHYSTKLIMESLDCYYIPAPDNLYTNYYKSCDKNPVHYGQEVYNYYSKIIASIINGNPNIFKEMQKNYLDLQTMESSIIEKICISQSYISGRILNYINNKKSNDDVETILELCNTLKDYDYPQANYLLGLLFFKGRGLNKNLKQAESFLRISIESNYRPAYPLLFDVLISTKSQQSISKMIKIKNRKRVEIIKKRIQK